MNRRVRSKIWCPVHRSLIALSGFLLLSLPAIADTGTLIPKDSQAPDPAILSLEEMNVEVTIDNGDAHVHLKQIFANHTEKIQEGTYRFALPTGSTVSDFAVWDGAVRIPAVILERKRAEEIYEQAKAQAIDPGLLEAGERDGADPRQSAVFTAQIVPIPAYGTKRLELDYHQRLATTGFKQAFSLPLKPDAGQSQTVKHFHLHFTLHSAFAITNLVSPLKLSTSDAHTAEGTADLTAQPLTSDFLTTWNLSPEAGNQLDKLEVITSREATPPPGPVALDAQGRGISGSNGHGLPPLPGVFEAQLLLAAPVAPATPSAAPRTVVLLLDNSLSMQWEKLERSYAALEATLHSLQPADRFNLILFNQTVTPFKPAPIAADPAAVQAALDFVRASKLRGGTDLLKALTIALAQSAENTTLVLLTDGGSDRGETVLPAKIAARYASAWKAASHPPHTAVFAIGDDADVPLLRNLAHQNGFLEQVLSAEPLEFHLQSFLAKLNAEPVKALTLAAPQQASLVYPLDDTVYPGSVASWVGQYLPATNGSQNAPATFTATATRNGTPVTASTQAVLKAQDLTHPQLPRLWAQARVDALLAQIDRDGESAALIDEIIRLSRRYKFVTPYTSFLAVPRALLRPRVIRPGDPVLRVRTDAQITSVIALFPFGLTKPLRHLESEDLKAPGDEANRLWETRFLAPTDMKDGTYNVRLILRDKAGNTYNEAKTFVIASTPPTVKLQLSSQSLHHGQALEIHAEASQSTRTLTAHLEGINPVTLRWNAAARANTGTLVIPPALPIGRYTLTVTAEDIAHNLGTQEVQVDVLP